MAPESRDALPGFPNAATPLGSSAYYSVRLSPERLHSPLALLYAWNKTLGDIPNEVNDPGVARLKLQWWREEIQRGFDGQARHPLTRALAPQMAAFQLPLPLFLEQADPVEKTILRSRAKDFPTLEQRLEQGQGALAELMARCHGLTDAERIEQVRRCGVYWGAVYLLRDFGAMQRRGLDPLPSEVSLKDWGTHARSLAVSAEETAKLPLSIAIRSNTLSILLKEIAESDFAVRDQRIGLPPLRKLWIAWRARQQNRFG